MNHEAIARAQETLRRYKAGKSSVDRRIISAEQWWKLRHWDEMQSGNPEDHRPASAWLFNVVLGKHADAMEAYPEPNILPREKSDEGEARMLSQIIPVILEQNDFEETYSDCAWQKMKTGTAAYGVFWDAGKSGGLGDVSIKKVDVLNLFWEPGITNLQESKNVFYTTLVDHETLKDTYPALREAHPKNTFTASRFILDDQLDTTDKTLVVDWYYKKRIGGRTVLHFCKFAGDVVLYSSEDDPRFSRRGWYDDGAYPFVLDRLFPVEGSPCGYGFIDICKSPQESIDQLGQALLKNAVMSATPRYFIRADGAINEEEFADWTRPLVHVNGNLGEDSLRPVSVHSMDGGCLSMLDRKVDEMKYTCGNLDVQNGVASGVTAASAIAALQETAGRTSRASTRSAYRAYATVIEMVIERIRQFYTLPRTFRILGEGGAQTFIRYCNQGLREVPGAEFPRQPLFDVRVAPQRQNPYSKAAQNELALQLFRNGVFNPQLSDQAVLLLSMMDFPGREELLMEIEKQNAQRRRLSLLLRALGQDGQTAGPAKTSGAPGAPAVPGGKRGNADPILKEKKKEHHLVRKARARAEKAVIPG